jgi:uncharacterized protein (DUF2147 family)
MKKIVFWPIVNAIAAASAAAQASPVGLWQSVDDSTGKPRAEVRIAEAGGVLAGRIERSLRPITASPGGGQLRCGLCTDDRRDQPLIGLEIIRRLVPGADAQTWEGGEILDPDSGKTYRLRVQLKDAGRLLEVRGFIGPFFRNQTWVRVP